MSNQKPDTNPPTPTPLLGGAIQVPVREGAFGKYLDLSGKLPSDADCIMILVNSGGGLNAGFPKPVGFVRLTHQLYLKDLEKLLAEQAKNAAEHDYCCPNTLWVTAIPIRSSEYVDIWANSDSPTD